MHGIDERVGWESELDGVLKLPIGEVDGVWGRVVQLDELIGIIVSGRMIHQFIDDDGGRERGGIGMVGSAGRKQL